MTAKGQVYGPISSTSYCWVLNEYSKLPSDVGNEIVSPCFRPRSDSSVKFEVQLYPGGKSGTEDYVSFYFYPKSSQYKTVNVKYSVAFLTSQGKELVRSTADFYIYEVSSGLGWQRFLRKNSLSNLPDDILVVSVEVSFCLPLADVGMADVLLSSTAAVDDLLTAWEKGVHSDVVFFVEGTELAAHKFVLAARSDVFAAMFQHDTLEKATNKIDVTDFDVKTVKAMLKFLYSGKLDHIDVPLALELLKAADKYGADSLKLFSSNFLMSNLDRDNACKILISADEHDAVGLKSKALHYVCKKLQAEDFDKYKSVLEEHPDVLSPITRRLFVLKE